jgi:hypothetical protein
MQKFVSSANPVQSEKQGFFAPKNGAQNDSALGELTMKTPEAGSE